MQEEVSKLLKNLDNDEMDIIDKLAHVIGFIRPVHPSHTNDALEKMRHIVNIFETESHVAEKVSDALNMLLIDSKVSTSITNVGVLSHNGFRHELNKRFYNKFLPSPPQKAAFGYMFAVLFNKKGDEVWVNAIEDEDWIGFFTAIFSSDRHLQALKDHLFSELLYAAEILSIKIASEEFDDNFIRLDETLLDKDSAFIALHRDINDFVHKIQEEQIDIASTVLDMKHIYVLIEQSKAHVKFLKKKSVNRGLSLALTYELERIGQMVERLEEILSLIKRFDTHECYLLLLKLFKSSVKKNATRNSLFEIYQQGIRILAKSVTNNTSEHGEHYITDTAQKYFNMFLSASGAGVIIAMMALIKINIIQADLTPVIETIVVSLNYGLGFVLIHLLGFTIATKQPAMTASTLAKAIEQGDNRRADQRKLVELFMQVSRSQFAAVAGNVVFALLASSVIAYMFIQGGEQIITTEEAEYYLLGLEPATALIYATIAGVWLFCSGLIAGYFDNRANYLELEKRYLYHPFLKKVLDEPKRKKVASYLHEHHGAIAGNFFFGVLLGITPYIGYLISVEMDIAHVAFSTAYLGYSHMHLGLTFEQFMLFLLFVFLVGLVNLSVSFFLALKVSLLSRDTYFGNFFSFIKLFLKAGITRPFDLFFPPFKKGKEEEKG